MKTLYRLSLSLALFAAAAGAVPYAAVAQDTVRRLPDSLYRQMGCGTYGPILARRDASRDVRVALGYMGICPEGPEELANLWATVPAAPDTTYVRTLLSVSSIRYQRVTDGLLRALPDRNLPTTVRLQVLGAFLRQLTGNLGPTITVGTVWRAFELDSAGRRTGRVLDSLRTARFGQSDGRFSPSPIDPARRAEIFATIARIAADPSEQEDFRIAARDVHAELSRLYAGRDP